MPTLSSALVVADLHLNAKPRDAYRWRVWSAITEEAEIHGAGHIFILGDLTHDKDFHSAHVVNGIADEVAKLAKHHQVYILAGNHDGIDPNEPYWRFLGHIKNVHYFHQPGIIRVTYDRQVMNVLMLPHVASDEAALRSWANFLGGKHWDCAMAHITVTGARPDIGDKRLSGISESTIDALVGDSENQIYSGDVHTRQTVGAVQYVGAPYHINFGDEYSGGCMLLNGSQDGVGEYIDFDDFPSRRKFIVRNAEDIANMELFNADQVKVAVELTGTTMHEWQDLRGQVETAVKDCRAELVGIDFNVSIVTTDKIRVVNSAAESVPFRAREAFEQYCKRRELSPDLVKAGFTCFEHAEP
jgi:hypothetical protein